MKTVKPKVKLIGENGNVFHLINLVHTALKKAKQPEKAAEFNKKAFSAENYDEVLILIQEYVEVL